MSSRDSQLIDCLIDKARTAQTHYASNGSQETYDRAALAAAWALMEPCRNRELSELAVATTGLGNVDDKIRKNHRKTLGLLRDIKGAVTHGIISENPKSGITEIARPVGIVGAVVPSTNPVATPTNNVVNALKGGNAIILSPSPKGVAVCEKLVSYMHAEFSRIDLDHALVQMIPPPSSKSRTGYLMESVDLLVVTGSRANVRSAYSSGTPAIGVGTGNVSVIVDETADLDAAASRITESKSFDNATSCSSENAVIIVDSIRDAFLDALRKQGGILLEADEARQLRSALFRDGGLNRRLIARDMDKLVAQTGLDPVLNTARFLLIEGRGVGPDYPESGEKLGLVATLYTAPDFDSATDRARELFDHLGSGHSIGIHTSVESRASKLAQSLPTCRVIVNQAHCLATGGSFDNGMPFSLSMGCGTWGGNSIDDNLHWRHFINRTRIVKPIPSNEPSLEDVFSDYWSVAGR